MLSKTEHQKGHSGKKKKQVSSPAIYMDQHMIHDLSTPCCSIDSGPGKVRQSISAGFSGTCGPHQPFNSQPMVEHANPQSLRCRPQQPPYLLAETSISPISSSFIGFTLSFYHLYRFYDVLNPSFINFQILS